MGTPNTPHALAVGEMIEEFRIVRVLGAGSFGIVYQCQNTYLPETAAIKEFLPPELAYRGADGRVEPVSDQTEETFRWARDRFLQEAKTLWELAHPQRHPNIVRVSRYREANGTAYMFMEFEQGRPLSQILEAQGRLSPEELDVLFYSLLDGLERVHAADVLHRDIKPANILVRDDGSPVLIDFGAARRAVGAGERSVVSAYTPVYAALEQYHDVGDQGPWTDIYSFGATLYQAVTGNRPLSAAERLCGGSQLPVAEECPGGYPRPILDAIDRALEIKPEDRPQSVSQWRRCLEAADPASDADAATVVMPAYGPDDPTLVVPPPDSSLPVRPVAGGAREPETEERRGRGAGLRLAALAAVLVVAIAGAGLYYRDWLASRVKPDPAEPALTAQEATEPKRPQPDSVEPVTPEQDRPEPDQPEPDRPEPDLAEPDRPERDQPEPVAIPLTRFADSLAGGGSGPIMVWLAAGEFQMGSPPQEPGRHPDERLHLGQIPEPFAVSETEITLGHYRKFIEESGYRPQAGRMLPCMGPDPSGQQFVEDWSLSWESPGYEVTDRHPVTCVSSMDAEAYAEWLSRQTGHSYRLPTELEWEYAARAGTSSSRFWGDDAQAGCRYANTVDACDDHTYTAPAGTFAPNPFNLREMLGNLAEWTCSEYAQDYGGNEARCSQRPGGAPRVFRGGSWLDAPALVRSAVRDGAPANLRINTIGFRLVRTLEPASRGQNRDEDQVVERSANRAGKE